MYESQSPSAVVKRVIGTSEIASHTTIPMPEEGLLPKTYVIFILSSVCYEKDFNKPRIQE
jgi:hypothetical protein